MATANDFYEKVVTVSDFTDATNVANRYIPIAINNRSARVLAKGATNIVVNTDLDISYGRLWFGVLNAAETEVLPRFYIADGEKNVSKVATYGRFSNGSWAGISPGEKVVLIKTADGTPKPLSACDLLPIPTAGELSVSINIWDTDPANPTASLTVL